MSQHNTSIAIINPKSPQNMGSILRAAGCYDVDAVFYTGQRYARAQKYATDTHASEQKIPVTSCENLQEAVPVGAKVVAVELVEGATPLPHFKHPDDCFYIFGPEDGTVDQSILNWCDDIVYIPTKGCMNLAATVNVLLYDRLAKSSTTEYGDHIIMTHRDTNNQTYRVK
jgi:tRNA(Leu) C34 or U34 (ribose-2'-O)-methylase TrmL